MATLAVSCRRVLSPVQFLLMELWFVQVLGFFFLLVEGPRKCSVTEDDGQKWICATWMNSERQLSHRDRRHFLRYPNWQDLKDRHHVLL
jgi:hypothetical protein